MLYSELELKPQGNLSLTIVKANNLKNMEMIGKSDPYVVVYIRPLFKVKTKVVENNLNPVWNQTFELIAEDKETQSLIIEVVILKSVLFHPCFTLVCPSFTDFAFSNISTVTVKVRGYSIMSLFVSLNP